MSPSFFCCPRSRLLPSWTSKGAGRGRSCSRPPQQETDEIDAQTARAAGFVSHVVSARELYDRTNDVLATITSRNRTSLETCKTYLANARLMETPQASDYAANLLALVMSSKG